MIITCEKCSTKFNLDESILKKEGSKVRCSSCRHVFKVYPLYDEKLESPKVFSSESPILENKDIVKQNISKNNDDLKLDDNFVPNKQVTAKVASPQTLPKSVDTENNLELDIDFSLDDDIDIPAPPTAKVSSPQTLPKSVDTENGLELDMDFSTTTDGELPIDASSGSNQGLEIEIEDDSEFDFDFSSENELGKNITKGIDKTEIQHKSESISPMDMDFSTDDEFDSDDDMFDDVYVQPDAPILETKNNDNIKATDAKPSMIKSENQQTTLGGQPIISTSPSSTLLGNRPNLFENSALFEKKSKFGIGRLVIIPIVLILLVIAGYTASIMTGIKIPYLSDVKIPYIFDIKIPYIDKIFSPQPEPVKLTPDQKTVNGKFVNNTISGTLFVINGEIVNHSKISCKDVRVEGTLIAANKVKVKNKTVFCGNIISEEQLKTLDTNSINLILSSSDAKKKFTVEPGKSIPFMVVFSDFPDNLENFTVAVTDFKRVSEK
ncbi:MAG: zinc-ribbon domain-containing protein [Desulfamplus sp.]|nr:zinc-ribbon domain-containing protein [Desulfamplus sp.]